MKDAIKSALVEMKRQALLKDLVENYELDEEQKAHIQTLSYSELNEFAIGPIIQGLTRAAPAIKNIGSKAVGAVSNYVKSGRFTNDGLATAGGAVVADGMNKSYAAKDDEAKPTTTSTTSNPSVLDLADNKPKTTFKPTPKFDGSATGKPNSNDLGKDVGRLLDPKKPVVGPDSDIAKDVDKALKFEKPASTTTPTTTSQTTPSTEVSKVSGSATGSAKPSFKFNSKGGKVSGDELSAYRKHVGNDNATLGQYMNARDHKTAVKGGANDPSVIQKKLGNKGKAYVPESLISQVVNLVDSQYVNPFAAIKEARSGGGGRSGSTTPTPPPSEELQEDVKGLEKIFPDHHKVLSKHGYEPISWSKDKVGDSAERHSASFEHSDGHKINLYSEPRVGHKENTIGWSVSEKLKGNLERFKSKSTGSWEGTENKFTHYDSDYGLKPQDRFKAFKDTLDAVHEGDKKKVNEELTEEQAKPKDTSEKVKPLEVKSSKELARLRRLRSYLHAVKNGLAEGYMIKRIGPSKNPKQPKFGKKTFRPEMTDKGKHADQVAKSYGYKYSHHSYVEDPINNHVVTEKLVNHHYAHPDGHKLVVQCGDPTKEKVEFDTKGTGLRKLRREKNNVFKQTSPEPKWFHTHGEGEGAKTFKSKDAPQPEAGELKKSHLALSRSAFTLDKHLSNMHKINEEVSNKEKKSDQLTATAPVDTQKPETSKTATRWQVTKKFDAQNAQANEEVTLSEKELAHIEKILNNKGE